MSDRTPTSVYLYYDVHDVLVYVGITSRGIGRNKEHNTSKSWWKHVVRQEVEHHPDRISAHAREVNLIKRFTPPFNIQHNPSHCEMREAYETMVALASSGGEPVNMVRSLGKSLPLALLEQKDNHYIFRTKAEHALVASRLFPREAKQSKVVAGDQRVGQISSVENRGPFALIHATIRRGCNVDNPTADLNIIQAKPITFQIRRIRLAAASQLAA